MQPFVSMYEYLSRARERLFDWIRPLSQEQYTQEFPYALKTIRATLVHTAASEWVYNRRIRGISAAGSDSPFTVEKAPSFGPLEIAWKQQAAETRTMLAQIAGGDPPVEYRFFPQGPGGPATRVRTTTAGIASQLVFHEVHHRSQVMTMLRQLGVPAQNLDFSAFMFDRQQESA